MKIKLFFIFTFLITSISIHAQSSINAAFAKSYEQERAGQYTKAITTMKSVYKSNSYDINLRLGWLHYNAGLFTEAASYYQNAIKLKPYSIEAKLGAIYPEAALGNWDKVITQYKGILKIDPNHSYSNYQIGMLYYGQKNYKTAYKHFEKVINLYPFDYSSTLMFAWTNFQLGKTSKAKVLFNKVLRMSPKDASALEGLSYLK